MSDETPKPQTALARTIASPLGRPEPIQPANFSEVMKMAQALSDAQLIPANLQKKPGNIAAVILTGRELGIPPMTAIRGLHCINDRVGMYAELQVALIERSGACEYWQRLVTTDEEAVYETKRVGRSPTQSRYTIEQARNAGLLTKAVWKAHPAAMLRRRAQSELASDVYPDVLMGMYDPDQIEDFVEAEPVVYSAPPPAAPAPARAPEPAPAPARRGDAPPPEARRGLQEYDDLPPIPAAPDEDELAAADLRDLIEAHDFASGLPPDEVLDRIAELPNSPEKAAIRKLISEGLEEAHMAQRPR